MLLHFQNQRHLGRGKGLLRFIRKNTILYNILRLPVLWYMLDVYAYILKNTLLLISTFYKLLHLFSNKHSYGCAVLLDLV